eukprot:gene17875-biopygen6868
MCWKSMSDIPRACADNNKGKKMRALVWAAEKHVTCRVRETAALSDLLDIICTDNSNSERNSDGDNDDDDNDGDGGDD